MPFAKLHRNWLALPLRARLTIWNTLVVLLITLAALVVVRGGLRAMLVKELDAALTDEAHEVALAADRFVADPEAIFTEMETTAEGHLRHGWFLQLFGPDRPRPLWSSANTPQALLALPAGQSSSERQPVAGYRFVERPLGADPSQVRWLRVGSSQAFIDQDVENVTRIMAPVMIALFLLAPIGGYALASRATSPLREIISTSRRLHPRQLDERLPVRGVGDELDELSAEINHFLNDIAAHLERNRQFVANAAHELRSPLTAMMALLDVALNRRRTVVEYEELLATLRDECQQLTDLIHQLLLLAESDAGLLDRFKSPVVLDEMAASCISLYEPLVEESGLTLHATMAPDLVVLGDSVRLRQVVSNLLDNAVKHTARGGRIEVTVARHDPQTALIEVLNTGTPVSDDELPRLFDRFYTGKNRHALRDSSRSAGLGLSISKAIVQAYGGSIRCENRRDKGVVFAVSLPLFGDHAPHPQADATV